MSLGRITQPLRMVLVLIFMSAVGFLTYRSVVLYRQSKEKGKLVATIVREQARLLEAQPPVTDVLEQKGWPDDFLSLQTWLILKLASTQDPLLTAAQLSAIAHEHSFSPVMSTTLRRWDQQLSEWSKSKAVTSVRSSEQLLIAGRLKSFQGSGYRTIGRQYDAVPLFIESIVVLSQFIQAEPASSDVPEALYLLGLGYLRLKHALPPPVRADRILNMVAELYPGTIWARQASAITRLESEKGA